MPGQVGGTTYILFHGGPLDGKTVAVPGPLRESYEFPAYPSRHSHPVTKCLADVANTLVKPSWDIIRYDLHRLPNGAPACTHTGLVFFVFHK